jgi:RNA polymerase sigma factor (sigma-70 family)
MIKILTADLAGVENLQAFAVQCVKFQALNILRNRKQKRETEIPETFEIASKSEADAVDIEWITRCPDLSERQREIVVLIINGNNCSEVAAMLNISRSTVSEHISRIRELTTHRQN